MHDNRSLTICLLAIAVWSLLHVGQRCAWAKDEHVAVMSAELRQQAVDVLRNALKQQSRWQKVHAAEYLLALDYPQDVANVFAQQLEQFSEEAEYRIGIWRVLTRSTHDDRRSKWRQKIVAVFLDPNSPDRVHAAETLAKLGYKATEQEKAAFEKAARSENGPLASFALAVLVNSGEKNAEHRLADLLASDNQRTRVCAAYAMRKLPHVSAATCEKLRAAFRDEPTDSPARVHLVAACAVHCPEKGSAAMKNLLIDLAQSGGFAAQYQALEVLGDCATDADLRLLIRALDSSDADVRSAAAYAILRLERRRTHSLVTLDWLVIGGYMLGMIAVGWYYARRTTTTDDYLLGGRNMNPVTLGLSLFATLLSTVTYLSLPGEVIRFGPMVLGMLAAFPLAYVIAGWLLIPFIMRLPITSAYELLETRLGLSVRMLGSSFFLTMRLAWMAVIIYATSDTVLVPLLGWQHSATPYLCMALGAITLVYTSMGGLRAVVLTDVVQTVVLFGAALITIVLVSIKTGGISGWWPSSWPAHWPTPEFGFGSGTSTRMTFLLALVATLTWWICTAGSDQMAIQRYLATRDARAARRVLATSLVANTLVQLILVGVGFALLAYFRLNPHMIADGQSMLANADSLFPRFIALALPPGVSGLVVAGLLAAAMSSLSSGINSSCSVLIADFIDRFRRRPLGQATTAQTEVDHIRLAKYVSVAVGVIVVGFSCGVGVVQGNLFEVSYKVINLLTVPLFGLFFMAMFVRWATTAGTILGAFAGLAVLVAINFWQDITGTPGISFLWGMPLGLATQILIASTASLVVGKC